jgi:hypothetical protein
MPLPKLVPPRVTGTARAACRDMVPWSPERRGALASGMCPRSGRLRGCNSTPSARAFASRTLSGWTRSQGRLCKLHTIQPVMRLAWEERAGLLSHGGLPTRAAQQRTTAWQVPHTGVPGVAPHAATRTAVPQRYQASACSSAYRDGPKHRAWAGPGRPHTYARADSVVEVPTRQALLDLHVPYPPGAIALL